MESNLNPIVPIDRSIAMANVKKPLYEYDPEDLSLEIQFCLKH
jgi:hypothetical protein